MQRPFTSGSRQAPDPFDQFLEEHNFYRKHTARDASCLFRVISEQMYDTQLHHLAIRKKCVRYMRKHRTFFQQQLVDRDLDEYLDDMSKPKTYGTLLELQAVGYMFQRNVLLFQPFNLGNYYNNRSDFADVFRVFYSPERHFDSVFTCDYIKEAAICQSICYEILYKDLYKLPDVLFAVERMLHLPNPEGNDYSNTECNEEGYCTRVELTDGRTFDIDLPQNTNCILENYKLCHFHYPNFPRLSDELQREIKVFENREDFDKSALCKTAESLLPNKYVSCVRQLLDEGITPFPYKVAKALDPNMYRNIEFDAWNEQRKEMKLQNWYNGDSNFKVGAKCHVKLCKSENDLYTCHIQEIAVDKGYCIVFIEQLGEKRLVPYDSLTPLPPDQFKPWTLPYRFQRQMQKYSSVRFERHYNYRFKFNGQFSATHEYCSPFEKTASNYLGVDVENPKQERYAVAAAAAAAATNHHRNSYYYKLKQYTHLENFRTHTVEYCTMPLTVEHVGRDPSMQKGSQNSSNNSNSGSVGGTLALNENCRGSTAAINAANDSKPEGGNGEKSGNGEITTSLENVDALEQGNVENGPGFVLPEFQYFYPMHQYGGIPEDYYMYGYDGSMTPMPAAYMSAGNPGTVYYVCNPAVAPYSGMANSFYMPTAPPPLHAGHPLTTPNISPHMAPNGGYLPNTFYPNMPNVRTPSVGGGPALNKSNNNNNNNSNNNIPNQSPSNNTPASARARGYNNAVTPLNGRINWDARKSVKPNGTDLPNDVTTLRHFYNLGVEYYHMRLRRNSENASLDPKENMKIVSELQNIKLDENCNLQESKSDSNNNISISNSNPNLISQNGGGGGGGASQNNLTSNNKPNRRFTSRYFNNNKDRQSQGQSGYAQRHNNQSNITSSGMGAGAGAGAGLAQNSNRNQNDQHNMNKNIHSNRSSMSQVGTPNSTPNSSRSQVPNATGSSMAGTAANGVGVLTFAVNDQGIPSSPMIMGYDPAMGNGGGSSGVDVAQTPGSYHSNANPMITYSSYDYNGDSATSALPMGGSVSSGSSAATAGGGGNNNSNGGGIYIPMPLPHGTYGVFPTAPGIHPPPPPLPPGGSYPQGGPFLGPPPPHPANMPLHGLCAQPPLPPPTLTNGFYAASGNAEMMETGFANDGGMQFQCMGYPPAVPSMYYSPNNAVSALNMTNGGNQTAQHQGLSTQMLNSNGVGVNGGSSASVSQQQQQKQHHQQQQQQQANE